MKRLVKIVDGSIVFLPELIGLIAPDNAYIHRLLTRLAAYEDTGLDPEEITGLKNSYDQLNGINDDLYRANEALGKKLDAYTATGLEPEEIKERLPGDDLAPICVGCPGKDAEGHRTELCGYVTGDLDRCIKQGAHLTELAKAEKEGRLVVLPEVRDVDRKSFRELLDDTFKEASVHDPSVGIYGMSDGERNLAAAIMAALAERERGSDHA